MFMCSDTKFYAIALTLVVALACGALALAGTAVGGGDPVPTPTPTPTPRIELGDDTAEDIVDGVLGVFDLGACLSACEEETGVVPYIKCCNACRAEAGE